ncbi:uncharacterized protein PAN0_009c3720 [Moesziomyces antarcticus]|uniref:Uncharacterized protein n=2 Tax=Pseudozyma antarctica TaxID=84753 RepID=A0A081CFQ7_PSEA2|nr:uncharacterized protein PAN0_009c3720 [Moesziomyces antarcticus]GAK65503.1 hypothetical protein PAN0_009c3720 [Moesziomyces antarcticus]SPO46511.1 uncharacterized protein PSANT_04197 [Moesziomyces antarcticus]
MYFNAVSVAVFALLSLAGAKADDEISTAGLVVDDKQVASYCGVPVKPEYKEVEFVCFTYKGDIQKAMTNPNRLKGFVNKAGNAFVVLGQSGAQSFSIAGMHVILHPVDTPYCRKVEASSAGENQGYTATAQKCPGNVPFDLSDHLSDVPPGAGGPGAGGPGDGDPGAGGP